MDRRRVLKILAASAIPTRSHRTASEKSADRQALLARLPHVAGRIQYRDRPFVERTPDLLAISGINRGRDRFYYGRMVFGSVGQLSTKSNLTYAMDSLRDGFTGKAREGEIFLEIITYILSKVAGNRSLWHWPILAYATPVMLSIAMNPGRFAITRNSEFTKSPSKVPDRRAASIELGPRGSPVILEIPPANRIDLYSATPSSKECTPTLVEYRTNTNLTVFSGEYDSQISEEVGLIGWEANHPLALIRTDYYKSIFLPGDGSPEAAAEGMTGLAHKPERRSIRLGNDIVVDYYPSIDVWMIDPIARPDGAVDGYLLKAFYAPDGKLVNLFGSRREMNHILARGSLIQSLLQTAVTH